MAWAWIENNNIFVTTDVTMAPQTAIDVPDITTPQDLVIDENTLRLKTADEKLAEKKQHLLQSLLQLTQDYILKYYPTIKQQSDATDKENAEGYLTLQNIDTSVLRKDITELVIEHYPNYPIVLFAIKQKYASDNAYVNYWLEQVIKIGFRTYFVFLVKQEYSVFLQAISNAKTQDELPNIAFTTPFPEELLALL
jgi:hypothetical protein